MTENHEEGSGFICKLSGNMKAKRYLEFRKLFDKVQAMSDLDNGYAFSFQSSNRLINQITEFIKLERECCPFFTFELKFENNSGPLWLRISGPVGAKNFIKSLMAI
ncbi:MAG: hypothetical protein ACRD8Z_26670 [Nitrososphaeraceae archaeon]